MCDVLNGCFEIVTAGYDVRTDVFNTFTRTQTNFLLLLFLINSGKVGKVTTAQISPYAAAFFGEALDLVSTVSMRW